MNSKTRQITVDFEIAAFIRNARILATVSKVFIKKNGNGKKTYESTAFLKIIPNRHPLVEKVLHE